MPWDFKKQPWAIIIYAYEVVIYLIKISLMGYDADE